MPVWNQAAGSMLLATLHTSDAGTACMLQLHDAVHVSTCDTLQLLRAIAIAAASRFLAVLQDPLLFLLKLSPRTALQVDPSCSVPETLPNQDAYITATFLHLGGTSQCSAAVQLLQQHICR